MIILLHRLRDYKNLYQKKKIETILRRNKSVKTYQKFYGVNKKKKIIKIETRCKMFVTSYCFVMHNGVEYLPSYTCGKTWD